MILSIAPFFAIAPVLSITPVFAIAPFFAFTPPNPEYQNNNIKMLDE